MRVFLDTNVLVSAFATRGLCADILRLVLSEHELVTGEAVLIELERTLERKIRLVPDTVGEVLAFMRAYHVEPIPSRLPDVGVEDPDDLVVLATAISAGAEVLVSGDSDLLRVAKEVGEVRITNPRGFWEMHRNRSSRPSPDHEHPRT